MAETTAADLSLMLAQILGWSSSSSSSSSSSTGSWERVWELSTKPVLLYYIPMLLACYGVSVFVLKQVTDWRDLKLQKMAGQISMYPAFFVLIYTAHKSMLDSHFWSLGTLARVEQSSYYADLFANVYIATNIVQAMGQAQTEKPPLLYQLMAHHVLSIACYTAGFYFDRFRWWTAFAGCCELTNLFLVPVFTSKEYYPQWRKETWFLWNSRLLWLTFVTHRLLLFPAWLALWMYDQWHYHTSNPQKSADASIHWVEGTVYPLTILGLLLLSTIWFHTISRGLKKQTVIYQDAQAEKQKAKKLQ